ncbi:MAG: DUF1800 family protein [Candidatus Kapaibacterium sp.]
MAALDIYTGPWDERRAAHLLRRTTFCTRPSIARDLTKKTLAQVIDELLADKPAPAPPVDPGLSTQGTWTYNMQTLHPEDFKFRPLVKVWWLTQMLQPSSISVIEKLTLFWHNHFATEADAFLDSRMQNSHNALLRRNAMGNFRTFVRDVTLDPAMLRYLNGDTNTAAKPNENYARELQELFTIGKGFERAPGDYTHYTEDDVKAAARVLTGWRAFRLGDPSKSTFSAQLHDSGTKTFSACFGKTTITGGKDEAAARREIDELIAMILAQEETARHIVRKLYRWFVFYGIDDATERDVIIPLAKQFKNGNYEIKPVLRTLLSSNEFFDDRNIGAMLKSPVDFYAGLCNLYLGDLPADPMQRYQVIGAVATQMATQQQNLMDPPSVAGWPAYYQSPDFYKQWINSVTLPNRYGYTDTILYGTAPRVPPNLAFDTLAFVAAHGTDASDAHTLVRDVGAVLMPAYNLTEEEITYLTEKVLMAGSQVYEWTKIWSEYLAAPTNTLKKKAAEDRLKALFRYMFRMGEFQLQ